MTTREPAFLSYERQEQIAADIEKSRNMSRQDMLRLGFLKAEELDDEEIRYGVCRDVYGRVNHNSRKMDLLPRDVYEAVHAEHQRRSNERLRHNLDKALSTMVEIMDDTTAEPRDRFEAAKYLYERVAGKTPDKVAITIQKQPWEEVFDGIAQTTRAASERVLAIGATEDPLEVEVEPIPYGHIQSPNSFTLNEEVPFVPEKEIAEEPPTIPPETYVPSPPVNYAAPTMERPRNTMATAPPRDLASPAVPEIQDPITHGNPATLGTPLSEQLRDSAERARERAEIIKERRDERKAAKKRRIVARTMGIIATERVSIAAVESDDNTLQFSATAPDSVE